MPPVVDDALLKRIADVQYRIFRSSVIIVLTIYALYLTLFVSTVVVMVRRKRDGYRWNLGLVSLLFGGITIYVFLVASNVLGILYPSLDLYPSPSSARFLRYGMMSCLTLCHTIADFVLVRRCYLVWERRKSIILVPSMSLCCMLALGIVSTYRNDFYVPSKAKTLPLLLAFYGTSFATNLLVTLLTAGRIYWLSKSGAKILGERIKQRYALVIAMVLESGLIYSTALLIVLIMCVVTGSRGGGSGVDWANPTVADVIIQLVTQVDVVPLVTLISGIAPTLLLLRAALASKITEIPNSQAFPHFVKKIELNDSTAQSEETAIDIRPRGTSSLEGSDGLVVEKV